MFANCKQSCARVTDLLLCIVTLYRNKLPVSLIYSSPQSLHFVTYITCFTSHDIFSWSLKFILYLNVNECPFNRWMQRPQFSLLHFVTFRVLVDVNFALVSKWFRLCGCLLLFIRLNVDKIFRILSSSFRMWTLSSIFSLDFSFMVLTP